MNFLKVSLSRALARGLEAKAQRKAIFLRDVFVTITLPSQPARSSHRDDCFSAIPTNPSFYTSPDTRAVARNLTPPVIAPLVPLGGERADRQKQLRARPECKTVSTTERVCARAELESLRSTLAQGGKQIAALWAKGELDAHAHTRGRHRSLGEWRAMRVRRLPASLLSGARVCSCSSLKLFVRDGSLTREREHASGRVLTQTWRGYEVTSANLTVDIGKGNSPAVKAQTTKGRGWFDGHMMQLLNGVGYASPP